MIVIIKIIVTIIIMTIIIRRTRIIIMITVSQNNYNRSRIDKAKDKKYFFLPTYYKQDSSRSLKPFEKNVLR